MERITRGMIERQLKWFAEDHPAPPEHEWQLERHAPGDRVYWRLAMGRKDLKGGTSDPITSTGYSTREMFEVLYFANNAARWSRAKKSDSAFVVGG